MYLDFFLQKCTFHTTFVQIGVFDWLSGWQKGSIFEEEKNV